MLVAQQQLPELQVVDLPGSTTRPNRVYVGDPTIVDEKLWQVVVIGGSLKPLGTSKIEDARVVGGDATVAGQAAVEGL